jgi:hypothetical protein
MIVGLMHTTHINDLKVEYWVFNAGKCLSKQSNLLFPDPGALHTCHSSQQPRQIGLQM